MSIILLTALFPIYSMIYLKSKKENIHERKIILEGLCNRIKGAFVENGHGMLTNQRFIYSKHSLTAIAVMGVLVNLTKGNFEFDIPIADIKDVKEAQRLFSKVLVITTSETEYKFYFSKLEEWKIAFSNVMHPDNQTAATPSVRAQSTADEILKFKSLLDAGAISEEEYNAQKEKLLNS